MSLESESSVGRVVSGYSKKGGPRQMKIGVHDSIGKLPLANTPFYAVWWPGQKVLSIIFCTLCHSPSPLDPPTRHSSRPIGSIVFIDICQDNDDFGARASSSDGACSARRASIFIGVGGSSFSILSFFTLSFIGVGGSSFFTLSSSFSSERGSEGASTNANEGESEEGENGEGASTNANNDGDLSSLSSGERGSGESEEGESEEGESEEGESGEGASTNVNNYGNFFFIIVERTWIRRE